MAQEVLYRKWRPCRFADVVGQSPVTTTLRNAVAGDTPAHAYLFTGPRGTGKTSTGRILAKTVNCAAPVEGEPCDECVSCEAYNDGRALDLIELDAASNRGIDEIRDLRESAGYSPSSGRYKIYLIDEVHMLTDAAFNALLKTLEEPPPHVIFILATTEPHRIPATITSRCQRFDFRRIPLTAVVDRLGVIGAGEGVTVEDGGFDLIAREATGSLRDAVNLLDQLIAYHGRTLDLESIRSGLGLVVDDRANALARASIARDLSSGLATLAAVRDDGVEVRSFVREVVSTLRALLLIKAGADDQLNISDAQAEELAAIASDARVADIVAALQAFGSVDFAGDAYDSLPAEIAFAAIATGQQATEAEPVPAPPPAPTRAAPERAPAARQAPPARQPAAAPPPEQPARQPRQPGEQAPAGPAAPAPESPGESSPEPTESRAPAAFQPPDQGEASAELLALRDRWDDILKIASRHVRAKALLVTAHIKAVDGDVVQIGFRHESHVDLVRSIDQGRALAAIVEAVSQAAGREVTVEPVHWEALQQAGSAPTRRSSGGHLVEEAEKLGATRVDD